MTAILCIFHHALLKDKILHEMSDCVDEQPLLLQAIAKLGIYSFFHFEDQEILRFLLKFLFDP